jgi:hypothetical protein
VKPEPRPLPLEAIDRRFAALRLISPADLRRLRSSIERDGIRHPVLTAEARRGARCRVVWRRCQDHVTDFVLAISSPPNRYMFESSVGLVGTLASEQDCDRLA